MHKYNNQDNFYILTSGPIPLNPAELLGSKKMKKVTVYLSILLVVIILFSLPEIFLRKVYFLKSSEALFNRLNSVNELGINSNVGSAYLTSFRINNFKDLILYTPLKYFIFYFRQWLGI